MTAATSALLALALAVMTLACGMTPPRPAQPVPYRPYRAPEYALSMSPGPVLVCVRVWGIFACWPAPTVVQRPRLVEVRI